MKYLRFIPSQTKAEGSYGVLKGDKILLLSSSPLSIHSKEINMFCKLVDVQKFLPLIEPTNIIALGLNYVEHANESKMELPTAPIIFLKATSALIGHQQHIILPKEAPLEVDYEAELTVVIGRSAKNVSEDKAFNYIFGYTCGNDVSARDCQLKFDKQWARGKSFDTFAPIGPVIETELDPSKLKVQCLLNGNLLQDGSTNELIFNIPQIVSYLSKQMTLLPGTLIMTGTPPGVGYARKPPTFLKPGDVVKVKIEGIGILENSIINEF
jgi:2-keto-4-pentenoate hydratase/2-oxohepta-3-ene-1,7-dioic acid hydratase in catechol pathway